MKTLTDIQRTLQALDAAMERVDSPIVPASSAKLTIGNTEIPLEVSFDGETIHIKTPLNIVFEANIFAVKTDMGMHVNPAFININEMKRTFLEAQYLKEHQPFKLKVKRSRRGR